MFNPKKMFSSTDNSDIVVLIGKNSFKLFKVKDSEEPWKYIELWTNKVLLLLTWNLPKLEDFILSLDPNTDHTIDFVQSDWTTFRLEVPSCPGFDCESEIVFSKEVADWTFDIICTAKYAEELVKCLKKKFQN